MLAMAPCDDPGDSLLITCSEMGYAAAVVVGEQLLQSYQEFLYPEIASCAASR